MMNDDQDPVERLLDECLATATGRWQAAVDAAAAAHPELADELRRRFAMLAAAGLVDGAAPAAAGRCGGFDLLSELGRGGMGLVWRARQRSTGRVVALKTIRPELLVVERARQRFRREVEAVSRLDHPGICTVYEAGEVDGMPFVAMRLVDGASLLAHFAARPGHAATRDGVLATVGLFAKIARALHHAHQAGILHRDVKPGNVMVDAGGEPVVLDFGLARPELDDGAALTQSGDELGTPAYMSPEQISPAGRRLDRRSDVYSLAVTLHEVLGGVHPFAAPTREELYRRVLAGGPPALHRRNGAIPGDLDVVLATAMDVDRDRRYETAAAFADELDRVAANQTILARRPSPAARLRRWMQREPLVASLMLLLLLGLGAVTFFAIRAEQLRAQAADLQAAATTEATTAGRVTDFLVGLFEVADRSAHRGRTITAREVLDLGTLRIQRELGDEPAVRARLLTTMGLVYQHLGVFDVARAQFEQALALRREAGAGPAVLAAALFHLGELRHYQEDFAGAEQAYRDSLAELRKVHAGDDLDVARNLDLIGRARRDLGQLDAAAALHEESRAMRQRLVGDASLPMADSEQSLAMLATWRGDAAGARQHFVRSLELRQQLLGKDHGDLPELMFGIAMTDYQSGRRADAKAMLEQTLAMLRRLFGDVHPGMGHCLSLLGTMAADGNDLDGAERQYQEALLVFRKTEGEKSREVATLVHNLATVARQRGDAATAMRLVEQSLVLRRELFGPDDTSVADGMLLVGLIHETAGEFAKALAAFEDALRIRSKVFGPSHPDTKFAVKARDRAQAKASAR
ncbi:MAG: serine/threonine protein kinase [Planctomycetes bacterium]|nr:serine/threonine protein kinase [Planctomycetota bacterium]